MTIADVDVVIPPFFCPVPAAIHPAVSSVETAAVPWLDRVGLHRTDRDRARLVGTHGAEFYARFAPGGATEGIPSAALWVYWGFAFDDTRCDDGPYSANPAAFLALSGQVQRAMEHGVPPADPCAAALQDVAARMRTQVSATVLRRFIDAYRHWPHCVAWQIGNRAEGRMPTVPEYLTMRIGSAGGPPPIALLEVANGIEVPSREMDSPAVHALTDMTHLIAALDNDLYSFRAELARNHTCQDIVSVLRHHEELAPAAAVTAAAALRDRIMVRFLELRAQVRVGASEELRTYLDGLGHGIRGNIDWAAGVPRYDSGGPLRITFTEEPRDANPEPLPYPAVSSWWDRLTV